MRNTYSLRNPDNKKALYEGLKAGVPIGLGYFAVSFSLGIAAANGGIGPVGGAVSSLLCLASAGGYAGFMVISTLGTYFEMVLMMFIANIRYVLMSCALSQRVDPDLPFVHRFFMGYLVTDEIFAAQVAREGTLNPIFSYGCGIVAAPLWSFGTALGCIAGQLMPIRLVSAFSVALYGMFLACIIPPARKSRVVFGLVAVSFILSYICSAMPVISSLSAGIRTVILTVVICSAAAILFPRKEEDNES